MISAIKQIFRSSAKKLHNKRVKRSGFRDSYVKQNVVKDSSPSSIEIVREINIKAKKIVDDAFRQQPWRNITSIIGKPGSIVAIEVELNDLSRPDFPEIYAKKAILTGLSLSEKLKTYPGLDFKTAIHNRTLAMMIAQHGLENKDIDEACKKQSTYVHYVGQNGEIERYKIQTTDVMRNNKKVIAFPLFWHELAHVLLQLLDPESGPRYLNTIRVPEFSDKGFELIDETLAKLLESYLFSSVGGFVGKTDFLEDIKETYRIETRAFIGSSYQFDANDAEIWAQATYDRLQRLKDNTALRTFIRNIIQPGLDSFSKIATKTLRQNTWSHTFDLYEGATGLTSAGSKI